MSTKVLNNSIIFPKNSKDSEVHVGPREWVYYDASDHGLPTNCSLKFSYIGKYYIAKDNFTASSYLYYTKDFNDTWSTSTLPSTTSSGVVLYQGNYYMFKRNYMYTSTNMSTWTQSSNSSAYSWQWLFVTGDGRLFGASLDRFGVTEPGGTTFTSYPISDYNISNIGCVLMDNTGNNIWIYSNAKDKHYVYSIDCGLSFSQSPDYMEYGSISGCIDGCNSRWLYSANTGNLMCYDNFFITCQPAVYPTITGTSGNVAYGSGIVCSVYETTYSTDIPAGGEIGLDVYLNYGLNDKKLRHYSVVLKNDSDRSSTRGGGRLYYANDRFLYCRYNGLIYYSLPVGSGMYSTADGVVVEGATGDLYDIKPKGDRVTILFGEEKLKKSYPYTGSGAQWQTMISGVYSDGSFDYDNTYVVANVVDTNGRWYYITDENGDHVTPLTYMRSDIEYRCVDVAYEW